MAQQYDEQKRAPRGSFILRVVEDGIRSDAEGSITTEPAEPAEPVEARNPYDVLCPYDNCGSYMAAYLLPSHVVRTHANDPNHKFSCPVCQFIMVGTTHSP